MPAVRAPALWLSAAATAITAVAVLAMASSDGVRRPLTFAGAILLPDSRSSSAPAITAVPPPVSRPSTSGPTPRTAAAPSANVDPAGYQAPITGELPAWHSSAPPSFSRAPAPSATASSSSSAAPTPAVSRPGPVNTPPTGGPGTPTPEPSPTALALTLFSALNSARTQAGLPPLRWNAGLQRSAAVHNQAMAAANEFASRVGGEPSLGVRQANQGVVGSFAAESSGYTDSAEPASALAAQQQMLLEQSPADSRRQKLLSTAVDSVGIAVLVDPAHGRVWVTEDFAQLS